MLTLIKHTVHTVPAAKLLVGDVIATKGSEADPQRLRRIDLIGDGEILVSTPRTGKDVECVTLAEGQTFVVAGRVEDHVSTKSTAKAKPAAKQQRATAKNPAPVKTTKVVKVDAVAQTTPSSAKPSPRPKAIRTVQPKAESSIRSAVRDAIRESISELIVTEVKALLAEALA